MADKKIGPQYLTADGRFTSERPDWMSPKSNKLVSVQKSYPQSKLSDEAAKKVADVLHVMLNDK